MNTKLGNLVTIKTGKLDANHAVLNGAYPFFTCSKEISRINSFSYDCECVLIAGNGDLNVKYYKGRFDAYQRTYIVESANSDILLTKYLYWFMKLYIDKLREKSIGGVIKYIKLGDLTNINLYVPTIEIQKSVVKILEFVENLLNKQQKLLNNFDMLIKSRFIELFGDPLINTKNWDIKKIKDIATEIRYGTSQASTTNGRYKYLRMNNLTYGGEISLADIKYIDLDEDEIEKYMVCKGDILFNRTNSIDLIGKTAVFQFDEPMIIAGYIIRIRLKKELLPDFFAHFMNLPMIKLLLKHIAKGAVNQANINARELGEINIYVPDLELQKRFIVYCNQINKLKFAIMVYN